MVKLNIVNTLVNDCRRSLSIFQLSDYLLKKRLVSEQYRVPMSDVSGDYLYLSREIDQPGNGRIEDVVVLHCCLTLKYGSVVGDKLLKATQLMRAQEKF